MLSAAATAASEGLGADVGSGLACKAAMASSGRACGSGTRSASIFLVSTFLALRLATWVRDWRGAVEASPALAPALEVASADATAITGALSFAAANAPVSATPAPAAKARPMGTVAGGARLPHLTTALATATPNTTVLAKAPLAATMAIGGQQWGSPWLRAALLTPSVTHTMRTTRLGATDPTWLQSLIAKPAQTLVSTFSDDPHLGMTTAAFRGDAVVFLATATFTDTQTASLR